MKRRILSMLLVLTMLLSLVPTAVFAVQGEEKTEINYVSLGDSMTNGYGLPGYDHDSGVEDYADTAYPNQFAEVLGENVNHAQLAMSGIRTEDIHWLLELDYNDAEAIALIDKAIANRENWSTMKAEWNAKFGCGDFWTVREICNHSRTDNTFNHIVGACCGGSKKTAFPSTVVEDGDYIRAEKVAVIAKYYQEKVAAADVISLSVGNGNIGVFGFGRILEVIGFNEVKRIIVG